MKLLDHEGTIRFSAELEKYSTLDLSAFISRLAATSYPHGTLEDDERRKRLSVARRVLFKKQKVEVSQSVSNKRYVEMLVAASPSGPDSDIGGWWTSDRMKSVTRV